MFISIKVALFRNLPIVVLLIIADTGRSYASENDDLQLIPDSILSESGSETSSPPDATTAAIRTKFFLDEAFQLNFPNNSMEVPLPSNSFNRWNNRLALDGRGDIRLTNKLDLTVADRFTNSEKDDWGQSKTEYLNDLKELFITWNPVASQYVDFGRINEQNGVALGFNPTDYFKQRAVTVRTSENSSDLRDNRLGTFMARGQGVWQKGAVTLAMAPKVTEKDNTFWSDEEEIGLQLHRTNDSFRFLSKVDLNMLEDLTPELIYFNDGGQSHFGLNLTKGIGDQIITYLEADLGEQFDVVTESLRRAREDEAIPASTPDLLLEDDKSQYQKQLVAGISFTDTSKRSLNIEYIYNEAGMTPEQWKTWFRTGSAAKAMLDDTETEQIGKDILGQLWTIRQYAQEDGALLSRHALFCHGFWEDAWINDFDMTMIAQMNLEDQSMMLEPQGTYRYNNRLSISLAVAVFTGSSQSEYGSMSGTWQAMLEAQYCF
jgi:hypothetical protein